MFTRIQYPAIGSETRHLLERVEETWLMPDDSPTEELSASARQNLLRDLAEVLGAAKGLLAAVEASRPIVFSDKARDDG